MGSADLSVVAPAISEALVATALGIFVAIPSSAAFNMISYWTQSLGKSLTIYHDSVESNAVGTHQPL